MPKSEAKYVVLKKAPVKTADGGEHEIMLMTGPFDDKKAADKWRKDEGEVGVHHATARVWPWEFVESRVEVRMVKPAEQEV